MFSKTLSFVRDMDCCGCFGFSTKPRPSPQPIYGKRNTVFEERLLEEEEEDDDDDEEEEEEEENDDDNRSYSGEVTNMTNEVGEEVEYLTRAKRSVEILRFRIENGPICRQFPVKETNKLVRTEDEHGNKMINEYVRECRIGSGSYGKVVLYRSTVDGKPYAIKVFHKSHLLKLRVAPSETAMTDVLREVEIMKMLDHPNIVNLIEVIDDPHTDHFYMVLEYVEANWVCEGSTGGIEDEAARRYLRDIVSGLMYLHAHKVVHGDIKPDNLLVTGKGRVKIADFSVSQVFEDDNDELRRSPGTPVFTAPECCLGLTYHGIAADTWAVGVTLHYMVTGTYPFLGDSLQDTYDKVINPGYSSVGVRYFAEEIANLPSSFEVGPHLLLTAFRPKIVNNPLDLPEKINPELRDLIEGLLCKDPESRMTLNDVAAHSWVVGGNGPIPEYVCWCKRNCVVKEVSDSNSDT